ncbi:3-dehydroquinate dehydratase, partial [Pasteurella multocida subsp. multocida str. Anand1_cattle]
TIEQDLQSLAQQYAVELSCFQANSEEKLIEKIHQSFQQIDFIIINPAAFYSHQCGTTRCAFGCGDSVCGSAF